MKRHKEIGTANNALANRNLSRRDWLKLTGLGALGLMAPACATAPQFSNIEKAKGPVDYPRLPGHKIQSPEHYGLEGCMVGYWPGWSVT